MSMTEIDERIVTKTIIERFYRKLLEHVQVDVAIVGGGPAGLVAGHALAHGRLGSSLFTLPRFVTVLL